MASAGSPWSMWRAVRLGALLAVVALCVWRAGYYVPQPGVNHDVLKQLGME